MTGTLTFIPRSGPILERVIGVVTGGMSGRNPMPRNFPDWLASYLKYTYGQESPDAFHLWCGIGAISGALQRSVWVDRGYYTLYPNLYIILVAESAVSRKSTALNIATDILQEAIPDYPIISQKITPEAFIAALNDIRETWPFSTGFIKASELSVFLGSSAKDVTIIQVLTDIYDCPKVFEYRTITRGLDIANEPYVCILAGTTPEWIKNALPAGSIGGGFTSRVIFVHAGAGWVKIPHPEITPAMLRERKKLVADLGLIGELKGEVTFSDEAYEWYSVWYVEVDRPDKYGHDLRGYAGRKSATLLKVAMVVSASRRDDLTITMDDLTVALSILNENEKNLPQVMQMIQKSEEGSLTMAIMNAIEQAGEEGLEHSKLLRNNSHRMNAIELGGIIDSLDEAGMIVIENVGGGKGKAVYRARRGRDD